VALQMNENLEEMSKHVGLVQQNRFVCFGLEFLHRMLSEAGESHIKA